LEFKIRTVLDHFTQRIIEWIETREINKKCIPISKMQKEGKEGRK
jgi:hypothetical protein